MIVYSAADLLWATRIKATAEALGIPCRPVRSVDMLRARLAESAVKGLIVDLEAAEVGLSLIRALRGTGPVAGDQGPPLDPGGRITIVAFGPHVAVDVLAEARAAGSDRVLARGTFDHQLNDILQELEGGQDEP